MIVGGADCDAKIEYGWLEKFILWIESYPDQVIYSNKLCEGGA